MEFSYVFVSVPFPNNSRTRLFPSFCVVLKTGELNDYPCIIYYELICARSEQGNAAFVSNNHQKTSLVKYKPFLIKSIIDDIIYGNDILYYIWTITITFWKIKKKKKLRNIRCVEKDSYSRHSMHDLILEIEHIENQHIYQE